MVSSRNYHYDDLDLDDADDELDEESTRVSSWYNHETEPLLHEVESKKLQAIPAMILMIASMSGVGVLSFPLGFVYAGGVLNGCLLQIPFLIISWVTINAIGMICRKYDCEEYEEMATAVLGERLGKILKGLCFIYALGVSIAYLVVVIDQGRAFFDYMPALAPLLCLLPLPFSFAENVAFLKYTGFLSMAALLMTSVTVSWDYFNTIPVSIITSHNISGDGTKSILESLMLPNATPIHPPTFSSVICSFPLFCFAYQGHLSSVKIYRRIEHPKLYPLITFGAFFVTFIIYNFVGSFAFFAYGSSINPDFLLSYPKHDFLIDFARVGTLGSVTGAYPVFALTARKMIWEDTRLSYRIVFGILWFLASIMSAIFCPGFEVVSGIIGSMAALIMFSIPGVCMVITYQGRKPYRAWLGTLFAAFGTFLFIFALLYNMFYV